MIIIIIENEHGIREALGSHAEGHQIVEYTSPGEAISKILQAKHDRKPLPDLLIVSLHLQNSIDGVETIRRLREHITPEELPVVIVQGDSDEDRRLADQYLLNVPFLKVPIKKMLLVNELHRAMKSKE